MSKVLIAILMAFVLTGCKNSNNQVKRIPVAKAGNVMLYYDEIPDQVKEGAYTCRQCSYFKELYK